MTYTDLAGMPAGGTPALLILGFGLLWTCLIGLVVGALAKLIMPGGNNPSGFLMTMLIGIAGSFLASFLGRAIGWYQEGQGAGFIASLIGAIILLWIYHMLRGKNPA